jgi:signal transduction histidine kinase
VQVLLTAHSAMNYVRESDQALNYGLAGDLAQVFAPFLADSLDYASIEHSIHELMVMNPRVEIYLIDEGGDLLAYFADPASMKRMSVDMGPVDTFLTRETDKHLPLYGDDPKSLAGRKPFSAAPVTIGGEQPGYVYVILGGQQYDSAAEMIRGSYIVGTSARALALVVICTAIVGLILFALVTRRLGRLTAVLERFEAGDIDQRCDVDSQDEIGRLGATFNRMADTIVSNMQKLEETDRLRRELIANVSHDLRSPLASMQGYLETVLIKEETLSASERRRYLETILANTKLLGKLIEELFELSKLDTKQVSPERETFSIAELAQDVVLMYQPHAEKLGIELTTEFAPDLPLVSADIGMVERVLSNLIDNALRYTQQGGRACIRVARDGDRVNVAVVDNGRGITPEDLPHIFDRFYRAGKNDTRRTSGTGLGLAIASKIIEAHGDRIEVVSTPGEGSTFSFELSVDERAAVPSFAV